MEDIHIYLKSEKRPEKLIYLNFNYYAVNRLKISLGIKIDPAQWDDKRELPKKSYKQYHNLKGRIDLFLKITEDLWYGYKAKGYIPSTHEFKWAIKSKLNQLNTPKTEVLDYINLFITDRSKSPAYTAGTIGTYNSLLKDLKKFAPDLRFDQINGAWVKVFTNYLYDKGLEQNTVHNKLSTLQTMLGQAVDDGVVANLNFMPRGNKVPRIETTQIYLNEEEIEKFYKTPVPPELQESKDIFVLMCYTGPRISDTWKIGKTSFFKQGETEYFSFNMKKTKQIVNIPVHPFVREILDKYGWELPTGSKREISDHIKEIGRLAGIVQNIDLVKYPGGIMTTTRVPKYSQIKTHTGRRSMACNMLIAGAPEAVVMAVGGWRSHKSFLPYIRLTADDKLKIASKSPFFTGARVISMVS